jgi:hypothetical protein
MIFLLQELPYIRTDIVLVFKDILFNKYNIINTFVALSGNIHISSFTDFSDLRLGLHKTI